MPKTKMRLKDVPSVNSPLRKRAMTSITKEPIFLEDVKKGRPFFTEKELLSIEKKYKEGMTKNDIMTEIYKKGWLLKESTIRNYIQINQIPGAIKRKKTDKGMISIYPKNTIRHLNFVRYLIFSSSEYASALNKFFKMLSLNDKDILESGSAELSDLGWGTCDDCIQEMWAGIDRFEYGIQWTEESIKKVFADDEFKINKYLEEFDEIKKTNNDLSNKVKKFEKLLEKHTSHIDPAKLNVDTEGE